MSVRTKNLVITNVSGYLGIGVGGYLGYQQDGFRGALPAALFGAVLAILFAQLLFPSTMLATSARPALALRNLVMRVFSFDALAAVAYYLISRYTNLPMRVPPIPALLILGLLNLLAIVRYVELRSGKYGALR